MEREIQQWTRLLPDPWPLRSGQKWHICIRYRSADRPWVLQLYDVLRHLGYKVSIDQYVPAATESRAETPDDPLEQSASAVLVWSSRRADAEWTRREFASLDFPRSDDFRFVTVVLDKSPLPSFAAQAFFVDSPEFREGPSGTALLQLLYGLVGQPSPSKGLRLAAQVDDETRESLGLIRSARSVGDAETLVQLGNRDSLAWKTSPLLHCQCIEALLSLRQYERVLQLVEACRESFPESIRVRQFQALALARLRDWSKAQAILTELYDSGERDAETLGILGRTWMDHYRVDKNKNPEFLEKSRDLYAEAFRAAPDDFYTGINAASKSALLGDLEAASAYAKEVESIVGTEPVPGDYWKTATIAEVKLLQRDFDEAARLYQVAVDQSPLDIGSHESTYHQALQLLGSLKASPKRKSLVLAAFAHLSPEKSLSKAPAYQPQPADRTIAANVLFGLVAERQAEPGLIGSLDPAQFWEAVRKLRPGAKREDLPEVADTLAGSHGAGPNPLWLAWLETVRSKDLDKLLQ